jgi:hypothetical protein
VERSAVELHPDGTLEAVDPLEERELPDEWVLRALADADLNDDATVVALLNEYGWLYGRYYHQWVPADAARRLWGDEELAEYKRVRDRADGVPMDSIEDARWWLKTARALAGTWSAASRGEDPASAWVAEGFSGLGVPPYWADPWPRFTSALSNGLEPFYAEVRPVKWGASPSVDLYSAACQQVFNLIVNNCDAQRCENETCGRTFVHQLGGSQFGQHRSKGLRFCTPECARAETQRQYRRRRKAARKEQP